MQNDQVEWKPSKEHLVSFGKLRNAIRSVGEHVVFPCGAGHLVQYCDKLYLVARTATWKLCGTSPALADALFVHAGRVDFSDLVACSCFFIVQVFKAEIWGGLFAMDSSMARPKRHILWSNDEMFLKRLVAFAGTGTKDQLNSMTGEPLVKPCTKPDGSTGFCGNGNAMKQSQSFG